MTKMGSITGHQIHYNGVGVVRGQRRIPSKNDPSSPLPRDIPLLQMVDRRKMLCVYLFIFFLQMRDNIITPRDTTMTFTCFVFFDMFNALSCRSQVSKSSSLVNSFKRPLSRPWSPLAQTHQHVTSLSLYPDPQIQTVFNLIWMQRNPA